MCGFRVLYAGLAIHLVEIFLELGLATHLLVEIFLELAGHCAASGLYYSVIS